MRRVEWLLEQLGHTGAQLGFTPGAGHGAGAHVAGDVEGLVVDPCRSAAQGELADVLAEARHGLELGGHPVAQLVDAQLAVLVAQRGALEDRETTDLQRHLLALDPPEHGVLCGEDLDRHADHPPASAGTLPPEHQLVEAMTADLGEDAAMDAPELTTLRIDDGPGEGVATLVLARPDRLNALSRELLGELVHACHWLEERGDLKVVVVRGDGHAFSAGFDLGDFASGGEGTTARDSADLGRRASEALTDIPQLTVAAIHGHCVGGGVVLAAACDLRVAADDVCFSIPEVDLGIPLAWGGIPRLVRELGPAVTKELVLTCRPFDASEAKALRFVNTVVARDGLDRAVAELRGALGRTTRLRAPLDQATGERRDRGDGGNRAQRQRRGLTRGGAPGPRVARSRPALPRRPQVAEGLMPARSLTRSRRRPRAASGVARVGRCPRRPNHSSTPGRPRRWPASPSPCGWRAHRARGACRSPGSAPLETSCGQARCRSTRTSCPKTPRPQAAPGPMRPTSRWRRDGRRGSTR